MIGIDSQEKRPSYKLQLAIDTGNIDPSIEHWLDFFCYKKAKLLLKFDQKKQIELYKQCPEHLRPMISKWVRKIKKRKTVKRQRNRC